MRFHLPSTPARIIFNYSLLSILCLYILTKSFINIADTTAALLIHLPTQPTVTGCNGHAEFCNRSYSNISQIGTHDSAFVGIMPTDNQNVGLTHQLDAGIRFLQAQTHRSVIDVDPERIKLCHTSCLIKDGGSLEDYLTTLRKWLDAHPPTEVITLLLTNGDSVNVAALAAAFAASGIVPYAYIPTTTTATAAAPAHNPTDKTTWPTLGAMLARNARLVVFLDYGADTSTVPYLLNEFTYFWETPYDTTDPAFRQCAVDRPVGLLSGMLRPPEEEEKEVGRRMLILNHFLDTAVLGMAVPDRRDAAGTNARGGQSGIAAQARLCGERHGGVVPKAVLVDYFDEGGGFGWQDGVNGVG